MSNLKEDFFSLDTLRFFITTVSSSAILPLVNLTSIKLASWYTSDAGTIHSKVLFTPLIDKSLLEELGAMLSGPPWAEGIVTSKTAEATLNSEISAWTK